MFLPSPFPSIQPSQRHLIRFLITAESSSTLFLCAASAVTPHTAIFFDFGISLGLASPRLPNYSFKVAGDHLSIRVPGIDTEGGL